MGLISDWIVTNAVELDSSFPPICLSNLVATLLSTFRRKIRPFYVTRTLGSQFNPDTGRMTLESRYESSYCNQVLWQRLILFNDANYKWNIIDRKNGHHGIVNVRHPTQYAASDNRAAAGAQVVGWERDHTWLIQKTEVKGQYTFVLIRASMYKPRR